MIGSTLKLALLDHIAPLPGPLLSLYVDVNPANPDTSGKAYVLRALEAVKALDLPKAYVEALGERLRQQFARLEGRSLVIFAGSDLNEQFDAYYLQTELPFLADAGGALAHWGRPLVAPLLFALDQRERHAAVFVATDRVRLFEVFLGQIEEVADYVRTVDTDSWVDYREARRSGAMGIGVAARGGADVDSFKDRMDEATLRLYRALMPEVAKTLEAGLIDRVILLGQAGPVGAFENLMPADLRQRVVGKLPGHANPAAPAREWLPLVIGLVEESEAAHEAALLDLIREGGVWGVEETMTLLQQNRLRTVVVPWSGLGDGYLTAGGWVAASLAEAEALRPGETVEAVSLLEVLPALVQRTGTVLEFVHGPAEERLMSEFAGMAGLRRW